MFTVGVKIIMKKYNRGFTAGTYDMFHRGHLNLLKEAKKKCNYLIVGVNSQNLVESYKKKSPLIEQEDRLEIINSIKYVDQVVLMDTLDKRKAREMVEFDVVFIGDDWKGSERWNETEMELSKIGVEVCYLPYTSGISSTILSQRIIRNELNKKYHDL